MDKRFDEYGREIVACMRCGSDTPMKGTRRCDRCWELESRIRDDLELAEKILAAVKEEVELESSSV